MEKTEPQNMSNRIFPQPITHARLLRQEEYKWCIDRNLLEPRLPYCLFTSFTKQPSLVSLRIRWTYALMGKELQSNVFFSHFIEINLHICRSHCHFSPCSAAHSPWAGELSALAKGQRLSWHSGIASCKVTAFRDLATFQIHVPLMAWEVLVVLLKWARRFEPLGLHDFVEFSGSSEQQSIFRDHLRPLWWGSFRFS